VSEIKAIHSQMQYWNMMNNGCFGSAKFILMTYEYKDIFKAV